MELLDRNWITVLPEDIKKGQRRVPMQCVISQAVRRIADVQAVTSVGIWSSITIVDDVTNQVVADYDYPKSVQKMTEAWDHRKRFYPVSFLIRKVA